jgi:hypothetical protein
MGLKAIAYHNQTQRQRLRHFTMIAFDGDFRFPSSPHPNPDVVIFLPYQ